jgi:hypothetical protein
VALVGILIVTVVLGVFAVLLRLRFYQRARESRNFPLMTFQDWVLASSPATCALALFFLFLLPSLRRPAIDGVSTLLDMICAIHMPNQLCFLPKPLSEIAIVHVAAYMAFVVTSVVFIKRIVFADYHLPPNFDPKIFSSSESTFASLGAATIWLFLLFGGQVYFARGGVLSLPGCVAAILGLIFGLICARGARLVAQIPKIQSGQAIAAIEQGTYG